MRDPAGAIATIFSHRPNLKAKERLASGVAGVINGTARPDDDVLTAASM